MAAAGSQCNRAGIHSRNGLRRGAIRGGAVTQRAIGVGAPAFHGPRRQHGACVTIAADNLRHAARHARDVDGRGAIRGGAVANLAPDVFTPTFHAAGLGQRTRVIVTGRQLHNVRRQAHDIDRRCLIRFVAVAQLTGMVATPALNIAGRCQDACVILAGHNLVDGARAPLQTGALHIDHRRRGVHSLVRNQYGGQDDYAHQQSMPASADMRSISSGAHGVPPVASTERRPYHGG